MNQSETQSRGKRFRPQLFGFLNRKLNLSITAKLTLFFGVIFAVVGAIVIGISIVVMNTTAYNTVRRDILALRPAVADVLEKQGTQGLDSLAPLLDYAGATLTVETADAVADGSWTRTGNLLTYTEKTAAGDNVYRITLTCDATKRLYEDTMSKIAIGVSVAVALLLVLIFGSLAARSVTMPITRITATTRKITKDTLNTRLDVIQTQDELKELADVINNMLDNLQVTIESQERFVSDASHEMRTPIAVIKGYASMLSRWGTQDEAVLTESIDAIRKEADNMQQLIDNLLFLSRTDRDVLGITYERFVLSELVDELVKEFEMVDTTHFFRRGRMEVVDVMASRDMIKQLLRIVIDNAKKYTPQGGTITLDCYRTDNAAVAGVSDEGIGIAPKDLAHVFDRFYRADKARNRNGGSGLGMSIAKKIADVHHGEIILESKLNEGTHVTLYLPLTQENKI